MDQEFTITITPAINIDVSHQLQEVIDNCGYYEVIGAGMDFINNTMDITFKEVRNTGAGGCCVESEE